jgi:hypothetical protein
MFQTYEHLPHVLLCESRNQQDIKLLCCCVFFPPTQLSSSHRISKTNSETADVQKARYQAYMCPRARLNADGCSNMSCRSCRLHSAAAGYIYLLRHFAPRANSLGVLPKSLTSAIACPKSMGKRAQHLHVLNFATSFVCPAAPATSEVYKSVWGCGYLSLIQYTSFSVLLQNT